MRLNPDHVRTLARAIEQDEDGETFLKVSMPMMDAARANLSLWEMGLLATCLAKAAMGKRLRPEQRVLLALFAHREAPE